MMLELELHVYPDGEIELYYEDRLEGRDVTFRVNADGTADEISSEPGPDGEDDTDGRAYIFTPVNLHEVLTALAKRVEKQVEDLR